MKSFFLFLFVASVLPIQNIMAQESAKSILAELHRRIDNPNANFRQYISSTENGTYAIKGYTKGSTNDPDSYKGLLIPHFDINIFGDNLAYASGAAPGLPTTPAFKSDLLISKTAITIKHIDNDIYLDSEFDSKTGNAIKPKDPFTTLWQCKSGQYTYDLPIVLDGYYYLNCRASYTCSHSSKVMPRTGRSASDDEFLENSNAGIRTLPNGQKYKTGSYDAYPPVNFNHTQTVTFSLTQMAQNLGCSTQELAALMVYHGIKMIPLNKDMISFWVPSDMEKDILSYCLYKLFNLNDELILTTLEKFNNNTVRSTEELDSEIARLEENKLSPSTNADELMTLAKKISVRCRNNADKSFESLLRINALSQFCVAQSYLATAYALKKDFTNADRIVDETKEYLDYRMMDLALLRFYMLHSYHVGCIKEYELATSFGCVAFNFIHEKTVLEEFLSSPEAVEDLKNDVNTTFVNVIQNATAADRTGAPKARGLALNVYQTFFNSPLVTISPKLSLNACELFFYSLIDEMRNSLENEPLNQDTAYFMGRITNRAKEFYNNYQLALEILHTIYPPKYEEWYKKSISESQGITYMQEYMKKNFYRTAEEDAFDKKMLESKYYGTHQMIPLK